MNWFLDLIKNPFLVTSVVAWFASQVLKVITHAIIYKEWDFKRFFGDGGMPSAHSATVSSLTVLMGIVHGFSSFQFAMCLIFTIVVCRDAVGVRWETAKQAQILNELRSMLNDAETAEIKLKEFVGHNPVQVFAGLVLGTVVALVMSCVL